MDYRNGKLPKRGMAFCVYAEQCLTKQEIVSLGYIFMTDYYLKVCENYGTAVHGTVRQTV